MTTAAFRVRFAVALGLPLVPACKETTPPTTSPIGSTGSATTPTTAGGCGRDVVHEWVCGLMQEPAHPGVDRYTGCSVGPNGLVEFDDFVFMDSSKVGLQDPLLAVFKYDAKRTKAYVYGGTNGPDDVRCCYATCTPLEVATPRRSLANGMFEHESCVPAPEGGASNPAKGAPQCPAGMSLSLEFGEVVERDKNAVFSGVSDRGECCYKIASTHPCPPNTYQIGNGTCEMPNPGGRPLREDGIAIVAHTTARAGWCDAIDRIDVGDDVTRAYAADAWAREGAGEHASVAAFARLAMELMIVGAPASLVDDAHVAARDEIRHASLAYGLASAFGGVAVGPGPLAMSATPRAPTLASLASETFVDGCIGETVAALCATEARAIATPAAVRDALATIVADETRHAELAFRIVAWAVREGGASVREQLAADLATVRAELARPASPPAEARPGFDPRLGILGVDAQRAVRRRVLVEIVVPCMDALLA